MAAKYSRRIACIEQFDHTDLDYRAVRDRNAFPSEVCAQLIDAGHEIGGHDRVDASEGGRPALSFCHMAVRSTCGTLPLVTSNDYGLAQLRNYGRIYTTVP